MTEAQLREMRYHATFESCPDQATNLLIDNVKKLSRYSIESLEWLLQEAEDYEVLFRDNASFYKSEGDNVEHLVELSHARSMKSLSSKLRKEIESRE